MIWRFLPNKKKFHFTFQWVEHNYMLLFTVDILCARPAHVVSPPLSPTLIIREETMCGPTHFPSVPTDGSTVPNCWERSMPRETFPTRGLLKHRFVPGVLGGEIKTAVLTRLNEPSRVRNWLVMPSPTTLMQFHQKKQEGFAFSLVL